MRIAVAQLGARRHYAIPAMLHSARMLDRFYTDICANTPGVRLLKSFWPRVIQPGGVRRLFARDVLGVPASKIECFPSFAVKRITRRESHGSPGELYQAYLSANREFCRLVAGRGLGKADTVYVFNGAGLEILEMARREGLRTIIEQTDAPVPLEEELLGVERERWPEWESGGAPKSAWQPMAERERAEWDLADLVLCGSEYVREGVRQSDKIPGAIEVVPYGFREAVGEFSPERKRHDGPLRVLFVGTICLRKGIPYLLAAAKQLQGIAKIRAVGPIRVSDEIRSHLARYIELIGGVPRSDMGQEYANADVLVLPSISEGSANVCYEALAARLPVVTTPNAGSVVRDGVEGFIIPIRSADAIVEKLELLAADQPLCDALSQAARRRAMEYTWDRYQDRLVTTIQRAFSGDVSTNGPSKPGEDWGAKPQVERTPISS